MSNTIGKTGRTGAIRNAPTITMEATLPSSQMSMEVNGLLVEIGEDLLGFALRFCDSLYGTIDNSHAELWLRLHRLRRASSTPSGSKTCSASRCGYAKITALSILRPARIPLRSIMVFSDVADIGCTYMPCRH